MPIYLRGAISNWIFGSITDYSVLLHLYLHLLQLWVIEFHSGNALFNLSSARGGLRIIPKKVKKCHGYLFCNRFYLMEIHTNESK